MWFWLISSIAGSILGSAADTWFADTKLGRWFYKKVDDVASWASKKLGLKVLQDENNWRKKYPNVSKKLDELEARLDFRKSRRGIEPSGRYRCSSRCCSIVLCGSFNQSSSLWRSCLGCLVYFEERLNYGDVGNRG